MENTLQKEQENQLFDLLSVLFLCVFLFLSSLNFPFTSLLFLIAAVVLRFFSILHAPLDLRILIPALAMLLWASAGLLYTPDLSEGFRFVLRLFLCLLMAYEATRSQTYMRLFLRAFFVAAVLVLASVYLQYLLPEQFLSLYEKILRPDAYDKVLNSYTYFSRPTGICGYTSTTGYILAALCGMAFVCAMARFREQQFVKGLLYALVFGLSLVGIVLVSKRSLFLAVLAICCLLLLLHYARRAMPRIVIFLILFAAVAAFLLFMQHSETLSAFFDRLTDVESDNYSSGRIDIYKRTLEFFLINPLLGQGSGSFIKMYAQQYEALGGGAHNIYLQLLCENGIPGLLLFGAFFAANLVFAIRALRADRENDLLCLSLCGQLLFLIYGIFGNPLYDEIHLCLYCLFALLPYTARAGEEVAYE